MSRKTLVLAALLLFAPMLQAQGAEKPQTGDGPKPELSFLLTLTLKVSDHGKKLTDQTYTLTALTHGPGPSVRDGDRVPITVSTKGNDTEFQYVDTGTNIDITEVKDFGSFISMNIKVEKSAAVPNPANKDEPIVRDTRYSISPAVPLGKTITVYSCTDVLSGHTVEIQLLAQPLAGAQQ